MKTKKVIFKVATNDQVIEVKDVLTAPELEPAIKASLKAGICHFAFENTKGETRVAFGTLNQDYIPPAPPRDPGAKEVAARPDNPSVQTYYDLEQKGWRAYRVAHVIALF